MHKISTALVVALSLFAAACGSDSGGGSADLSTEDQAYVDAAMASFDPEDAAPLTEDDARCVVESLVGAVGSDSLREKGLDPEDFGSTDNAFPDGLSEKEANAVVDGFDGCIDLSGLFLDQMGQDDSLDKKTKDCLAKAFDDKTIRNLFVTILTKGEDALSDDPDLMSSLLKVFSECPGAIPAG